MNLQSRAYIGAENCHVCDFSGDFGCLLGTFIWHVPSVKGLMLNMAIDGHRANLEGRAMGMARC